MKNIILTLCFMLSFEVFAHGDHHGPGSTPPAPNGGTLKEASHKHIESKDHNEKDDEERRVYFEAVKKGVDILIYPLLLTQEDKHHKSWKKVKTNEFSNPSAILVDPRKKKKIKAKLMPSEYHWKINTSTIKARRLILNFEGVYKKEKFKASIQVEESSSWF